MAAHGDQPSETRAPGISPEDVPYLLPILEEQLFTQHVFDHLLDSLMADLLLDQPGPVGQALLARLPEAEHAQLRAIRARVRASLDGSLSSERGRRGQTP